MLLNPITERLDEDTMLEALTMKKRSVNSRPLRQERKHGSSVQFNTTSAHLTNNKWLVVGNEGGVCVYCKLFINGSEVPNKIGKFVTKPWCNYSRVKDISEHEANLYHKNSATRASNFLSTSLGQTEPINILVNNQKRKAREVTKQRLHSIIKSLVFCARQGLALRGHRNESQPLLAADGPAGVIRGDVNRGNFLQLLDFRRDSGDNDIDIHVNKRSKYTSPSIQNELLNLAAQQITDGLIGDIQSSKYFAIIADETTDVSNTEQLCVALRYYDNDTKQQQTEEKFIEFVPVQSLRGKIRSNRMHENSARTILHVKYFFIM